MVACGDGPTAPTASVTGLAVTCMPEAGGHQCRATAQLSNNSTKDVTNEAAWTSSDPNVGTVDPRGRVTHLANGQTEINNAFDFALQTATPLNRTSSCSVR
jgi:uncharacterized protein YjdB